MAVLASTHDGTTAACVHRLVNRSKRAVKAFWVDFNSQEVPYAELPPGTAQPQSEGGSIARAHAAQSTAHQQQQQKHTTA